MIYNVTLHSTVFGSYMGETDTTRIRIEISHFHRFLLDRVFCTSLDMRCRVVPWVKTKHLFQNMNIGLK